MAVLLRQVMPAGVDVGMLDEVTDEMGVAKNPPSGLVVHVHFMENDRVNVVDVWDSAEALEAFRSDRLMPAIQKVFEKRGVSMDAQPESSLIEVPSILRG